MLQNKRFGKQVYSQVGGSATTSSTRAAIVSMSMLGFLFITGILLVALAPWRLQWQSHGVQSARLAQAHEWVLAVPIDATHVDLPDGWQVHDANGQRSVLLHGELVLQVALSPALGRSEVRPKSNSNTGSKAHSKTGSNTGSEPSP